MRDNMSISENYRRPQLVINNKYLFLFQIFNVRIFF
jgi:hypothetical protein